MGPGLEIWLQFIQPLLINSPCVKPCLQPAMCVTMMIIECMTYDSGLTKGSGVGRVLCCIIAF